MTGRSLWETRSLVWAKLAQGMGEVTDDLVRDVSSGKWATEMRGLAHGLGATMPNSWAESLRRDTSCVMLALHEAKMVPQNTLIPSQATMSKLNDGIMRAREQLRDEMEDQRLRLFSGGADGVSRYCEHGWEEDAESAAVLIEGDIEDVLSHIASISGDTFLSINRNEPLDSFANLCVLMANLAALAVAPGGDDASRETAQWAQSCYDECYEVHVAHWMPHFAGVLSRFDDRSYFAELGCFAKEVVPLLA